VLTSIPPNLAAQEVGISDWVRYNTVCAQCHEGECSGRLSFGALSAMAASDHIRRFAGAVSARETSALFYLLRYTKEHCAYHPMSVPDSSSGYLDASTTAQYQTQDKKALFLPLGRLEAGSHSLELAFDPPTCIRIEVLSADFEFAVDQADAAKVKQTRVVFETEESHDYYLRIRAALPFTLIRIGTGLH
jgi:hypothetical protein